MPNLRIIGEVQTGQAEARVAALTRQVEALNVAMAQTASIPAGGSPKGFTQTTAALGAASRAYNEALAASGAFRVENLKVNDVIAQQTDLLRRQKLGFSQIWGSQAARKRMQLIRREQQAMRNMTVRAVEGGIGDGHLRANLAIPAEVPKSWDTLRDRVGMFSMELQSASRVLLNWGKNTQWAGRQLMAGITFPVAAFGAAAGVMAYKVDKEFTRIQKVYNTTADVTSKNVAEQIAAEKELEQVREQGGQTALKAAKEYGSAMTDTLAVQADLAATGQKGIMLQGATTEVMKNAMLGEIDVQTTTKATIALQQQLHLSTKELGDQWAYLNSMENQTSLTMQDFATAIPIALGPLKQMGGTVQDLGTLLTAMVSRGVAVGKAANAIKATAQRLLRPSAQVAEEFRAITGADIKEIAGKNQGNMMGIMKDLYEVTKDLTDYDKSKAFAGLFGSYQLATMSAMVDGMGDLSNGMTEVESQVVMAQKVGQQSAAEWRRVQDLELQRMQESVSGKFKRTLETVKASLALAGEPFLDVATMALEAANKILGIFNAMDAGTKKIVTWGAIFVALAGPTIMITGLFANLVANAGLITSGALKMVSAFNLLNKAEWAQMKIDQQMEKEMYSTTSAMKNQQLQLEALTRAMYAHNEAMAMSPGYAGTPAGKRLMDSIPAGGAPYDPMTHKNNTANLAGQLYWNEKANRYGESGVGADGKKTYTFMSKSTAELKAQQIYAEEIARSQGMSTRQAWEQKRAWEKTNNAMSGANVAMGAMAASTVLMVQQTSETGQNIGEWMMLLAIGIPAMKGLASGIGAMGGKLKEVRENSIKTQAAMAATGGSTRTLARTTGKLGAGLKGAGAALVGMTGTVGLVAAGIAVAGFGAYKLYQHEKKVTEEKRKQANAMYDQKNLLEEQLKITQRQRQTLSATAMDPRADKKGLPSATTLAEEMAKSEDYKPLINLLKDDDALESEKRAAALIKYREVLQATGGTAEKATLYLEAMFRAAGEGAFAAQRHAEEYRNSIGTNFTSSEALDLWKEQVTSIYNDTDDMDSIKEQGKNMAYDFQEAILLGGRENADKTFGQFAGVLEERMKGASDKIAANMPAVFETLGIESEAAASDFVQTWATASWETQQNMLEALGMEKETPEMSKAAAELNRIVASSDELLATMAAEQGMVKQIGADLGISEEAMKDINTLAQIRATWEFKVATATEENAVGLFKQKKAMHELLAPAFALFGVAAKMSDEDQIRLANQLRESAGLSKLTTIYEVNAWLAGQLTDETDATTSAVKRLAGAWAGVKLGAEMKNILQQGMQGVTGDLADAASETFENRMDSAIEGAQAAWDRRIENLNDRHERAMDAFDERWERRKERVEAAYDAQIAGIDKAIEREEKAEELRQKMFEAEMTRIERLKEARNADIDFNVALRTGDLDEAARIQNDMSAQAQQWALSDAQASGADRSQAKIDALGASKDEIEEAKDKRLEAMAEIEEKQREHLQKMQEQESESLQNRSENAMENMRDQWEAERKNLNDKLELFRSYTAMNKKDLDRWLAEVGLSYDDFGNSTMLKGEDWAGAIQKSLKKHVREAGMEIASSQLWEQWANDEAKATLQGMGFGGLGQFKKFIRTGELPSDFGRKKPQPQGTSTGAGGGPGTMGGNDPMYYHTGGVVGVDRGGRNGVARTARSHSSEIPAVLQRGEGVLNRDAMNRYGSDIVSRMNKGQFEGGLNGPAGFMAAMAMKGLVSGVSKAYSNAVEKKKAQLAAQSAMGSMFGYGALGNYELGGVKPWVQEAANYLGGKFGVSNILGVGERATNSTSDHPKGLAIDLMTGANTELGNSIAAEALRIQDVLDATYMIFNGRIHSFDSRGWRPYSHPSGATDDTSMHRDHVHISFEPSGVTGDLPTLAGVGTGPGGKHPAAAPGKGWLNTHDYQNGLNSRLYAFNDAEVIESRAVTAGGSPGNGLYGGKYRSYGETIVLRDSKGNTVRYAHLAPDKRFVNVGDVVPGGTIIGLSGMTGNASGPHTHFEWNGSENASGGFAGYGIPLRTGGFIKKDNVPATLHKDEQVVDKKRTKKLYSMVDNFDYVSSPWFNSMGAQLNAKGMPVWNERSGNGVPGGKGNGNGNSDNTDSGKGFTLRTGTLNLYRPGTNANAMADLTRLLPRADVLSLTEFAADKRQLRGWLEQRGWGVWAPGIKGVPAPDTAVTWNKAKMDFINGGATLLPGAGRAGMRDRVAVHAKLEDKKSGRQFHQISAHTAGWAQRGNAAWYESMIQQYRALDGLVTRLDKTGLPVILGGDLNSANQFNQGKFPWNDILKDMFGGKARLDRIFASGGITPQSAHILRNMKSDHPALLSMLNIPGLSKGTQNIRFDNTLANLHKGEAVLTEDLNRQFKQGVANFASGGQTVYNTNVILNEADMSPEELAHKIERIQQRKEARVAPRRTNR